MLRDTVLALGLLLSTASQLRPGTSPVGFGEILLVVWSVMMLGHLLASGDPVVTPALSALFRFWGAFAFAECLGYITGLALDVRTDPQWFIHDVLAYPLVALVSCLSALETTIRIRRIAWVLSGSGALALAVQLLAAAGLFQIPGLDPWYWERLRGWSANPNQLALLCAALSMLSLHLADTAAGRPERVRALTYGVLPVVVGRLTGSDTFTLMLLASGLLFAVLKLITWLHLLAAARSSEVDPTSDMIRPLKQTTLERDRFNLKLSLSKRMETRVAYVLLLVIAVPLLASSLLPAAISRSANADGLAMGLMKNGGKDAHEEADLRLALWSQALTRGFETGLLGLGPGPHLAIPMSLVHARATEANAPGNIQHPQNNGAPNFEAHNTMLDLFVQGGILADISFIWLLWSALRQSYRARLAGLTTLLCCLTFFGMTNLIIRQPLFWFAIVSCLAATPPMPAMAAPNPSQRSRNNWIVVEHANRS
jgi:hypothetical protein